MLWWYLINSINFYSTWKILTLMWKFCVPVVLDLLYRVVSIFIASHSLSARWQLLAMHATLEMRQHYSTQFVPWGSKSASTATACAIVGVTHIVWMKCEIREISAIQWHFISFTYLIRQLTSPAVSTLHISWDDTASHSKI